MTRPPKPRYLGPAAHTSPGENKPIHRIVLHSTVSPCQSGGAAATARYFRSSASSGSAHYVVDPTDTVQVVFDSVIAWHAPPNPNSLGIEMCDMPTLLNLLRWVDKNHRDMLKRAALLTAQLCVAYDVPPAFLSIRALKAGKHGITTHNNVSKAFGQSSHWDPGAWPKRLFMRMVRTEVARLKEKR